MLVPVTPDRLPVPHVVFHLSRREQLTDTGCGAHGQRHRRRSHGLAAQRGLPRPWQTAIKFSIKEEFARCGAALEGYARVALAS